MQAKSLFRRWVVSAPGSLALEEVAEPGVRADGILVRIEAATMLSYMDAIVAGTLPYALPTYPFVPGTNAVGRIIFAGAEAGLLAPGDRVFLSPHLMVPTAGGDGPQILIGLTAIGDDTSPLRLQRIWHDGVFAEVAHWPAVCATRISGLDYLPAERLAVLAKLVVPYGGLLRSGLTAGETVIINGATGYFGSGAVLVALAMGAARVVAVGRNTEALARIAALDPRVEAIALTGIEADDQKAIASSSAGAARGLDLLGRASDTSSTLATLRSLRRGGRLVLMGSAAATLNIGFAEMLENNWEVVGNFMYPKEAPAKLVALVRSGLLDLGRVRIHSFQFEDMRKAMTAASHMRDLDCITLLS